MIRPSGVLLLLSAAALWLTWVAPAAAQAGGAWIYRPSRGDCGPRDRGSAKWIALHALADGGWSGDHGKAELHYGPVRQAGTHPSRTGATGLALLSLFARHGRLDFDRGDPDAYDAVVAGLEFLRDQGKRPADGKGLDFRGVEGTMIDHALATAALATAYDLYGDADLRPAAQGAVDFLVAAQAEDGGWRLRPDEPTELRTFAWCVLALSTARRWRLLEVDSAVVARAHRFLDARSCEGGARYGWNAPCPDAAATPIGLGCRRLLGTPVGQPAYWRGVRKLSNFDFPPEPLTILFARIACIMSGPRDLPADGWLLVEPAEGPPDAEGGSVWPGPERPLGADYGRLGATALESIGVSIRRRELPAFHGSAPGPTSPDRPRRPVALRPRYGY